MKRIECSLCGGKAEHHRTVRQPGNRTFGILADLCGECEKRQDTETRLRQKFFASSLSSR
jgi:uncharacterized protein YlaI